MLHLPPLRRKNNEALYLQVAAMIRRDVANGRLRPAERLPSIPEMAVQYKVSTVTARRSLAMLEDEGLLKRFQGRGTFIVDEPKIQKWLILRSDMTSSPDPLMRKTVRFLGSEHDAQAPNLDQRLGTLAASYRHIRRVHSANDLPYALVDIFIRSDSHNLFPADSDSDIFPSQFVGLKNNSGYRLHQSIFVTTADPDTAQTLCVPVNSAIGDVLRVMTDGNDSIVYIGKAKCRGDFVKLEFHPGNTRPLNLN